MDIFNTKRVAGLEEQCRQKQARIDRINKSADDLYGYGGAFDMSALSGDSKRDIFSAISELKAYRNEESEYKKALESVHRNLDRLKREVCLNEEKRAAKRKAKKLKKKAKADLELINAHIKVGDKFEYAGIELYCADIAIDDKGAGIKTARTGSVLLDTFASGTRTFTVKDLPLIKVVKAKK